MSPYWTPRGKLSLKCAGKHPFLVKWPDKVYRAQVSLSLRNYYVTCVISSRIEFRFQRALTEHFATSKTWDMLKNALCWSNDHIWYFGPRSLHCSVIITSPAISVRGSNFAFNEPLLNTLGLVEPEICRKTSYFSPMTIYGILGPDFIRTKEFYIRLFN